jgi:hypothetical protein
MTAMQTNHTPVYWNIYPAAIALAGIIVFIFATFGPPASSSGFVSALKGLLQSVAPDYVASKAHYQAIPGPGSWLMAFVLGMAIGGFIAGRTFPRPVRDVPEIWEAKFGPGRLRRYAVTFLGGFLILFASGWPAGVPSVCSYPGRRSWPSAGSISAP